MTNELKIIRRNNPKSRTRPSAKFGIVKRALITFVSRSSGLPERWAVDVIFSASRKKPLLLIYKKKGMFARFYFPFEMSDRNDQVVNTISAWFANLRIHDENATLNILGPPKCYDIAIFEAFT